jgi:hypothetical protein
MLASTRAEIARTAGLDIFQTFNEVGLQVKRATGGSQQPWVASSPIQGTFYFAPPQDGANATPMTQSPPVEPIRPASAEPKLARLPESGLEQAPRPRSANESCTRSSSFTICASSILPPDHGNTYGLYNLLDGNDATAWVEGSGGQGVGEFLVLEFNAPQSISGLTIRNGYHKSNDLYSKNSRVKEIHLIFSTGDELDTTLRDTPSEQHVALNRPVQAKWVQLIIRSVYPGWKYTDTAINELRVDTH